MAQTQLDNLFIVNKRLTQIGLEEEFKCETNPLPWMSEVMNLRK
jgi:ribonucleoside-diphosphate reductase beta chain